MKVAIITGGAQGIGMVTAATLSDGGWQVAILDTDEEALSEIAGEGITSFPCDVTNEQHVQSTVNQIIEEFGRLDAIVNNAAISANKPVEELSLEDWNRVLGVNLTGAFLLAKHGAKHLRQQRGAIVNLCSTRAHMSEPNTEAYSASKGGIFALTHALAMSLSPDIRVNSISPGWIDVTNFKKESERKEINWAAKHHEQHPVGRIGTPHDVAAMVKYLLSEKAAFITGQDFVVDGGMTRKMIYV